MSCVETDNKNHMFGGMESCSLQPVRDDEEEPHEDDEEEEELDENGMSYMVFILLNTLILILLV